MTHDHLTTPAIRGRPGQPKRSIWGPLHLKETAGDHDRGTETGDGQCPQWCRIRDESSPYADRSAEQVTVAHRRLGRPAVRFSCGTWSATPTRAQKRAEPCLLQARRVAFNRDAETSDHQPPADDRTDDGPQPHARHPWPFVPT